LIGNFGRVDDVGCLRRITLEGWRLRHAGSCMEGGQR
jgi:hypothetical protein